MLTFLIYVLVVTIAFVLGRISVKHPIPLSMYELQELRKNHGNSIPVRISKGKNRILDYARQNGRVTNDDVEDLLLVSDSTAYRYLHELALDGYLIQMGDVGRGVYYTLAGKYLGDDDYVDSDNY